MTMTPVGPTRRALLAGAGLGLAAMLMTPVEAGARDVLRQGAQPGTAIPHDLSSRDHTGTARRFADLKGENGLLLIFSRSISW